MPIIIIITITSFVLLALAEHGFYRAKRMRKGKLQADYVVSSLEKTIMVAIIIVNYTLGFALFIENGMSNGFEVMHTICQAVLMLVVYTILPYGILWILTVPKLFYYDRFYRQNGVMTSDKVSSILLLSNNNNYDPAAMPNKSLVVKSALVYLAYMIISALIFLFTKNYALICIMMGIGAAAYIVFLRKTMEW